jgi:hypothetical protein
MLLTEAPRGLGALTGPMVTALIGRNHDRKRTDQQEGASA